MRLKEEISIGFTDGGLIGLSKGKTIGLREGKNIGLVEGELIDLDRGKTLGLLVKKIAMAKIMLNKGAALDFIAEVTGLSLQEI